MSIPDLSIFVDNSDSTGVFLPDSDKPIGFVLGPFDTTDKKRHEPVARTVRCYPVHNPSRTDKLTTKRDREKELVDLASAIETREKQVHVLRELRAMINLEKEASDMRNRIIALIGNDAALLKNVERWLVNRD